MTPLPKSSAPAPALAGGDAASVNGSGPQRSTALLHLASALNVLDTLDDLMVRIAEIAAGAVGVDCAQAYAYDETRTRTIAAGAFGLDVDRNRLSLLASIDPHSLPAELHVIRSGQPLFRDRTTPFPDPFPPVDWHSDLVVPLLAAGTTQGVLYVRQRNHYRTFSREDVALLQALGHLAGLAILRVRESEAAQRRADHIKLISRLGQALSTTLDLEAICITIHREVRSVVAAEVFFIALLEPGGDALWFPYRVDGDSRLPVCSVALDEGPTSHVVRTRQTLLIGPDHPLYRRAQHFGQAHRTVKSALFVPLIRDDRLIGVLSVQRYDGVYDAEDVRIIETIAHQSAAAVAHAQLFAAMRDARDAAEYHAAHLRAVLGITRLIASETDLSSVLRTLGTALADLVPHDRLAVYRVSTTGQQLELLIRAGEALPSLVEQESTVTGPMARVLATGQPALVSTGNDLRSAAALAPLVVSGRVTGVLRLDRVQGPPFSDHEFTVVRLLAEHAAIAVRNAELVAHNRDLYLASVRALTSAVDAKDPYTRGHSERVARLAGRTAAALGLDEQAIETIMLAGLLHDIGKIGVPDSILLKPDHLDEAERAIMIRHAEIGAEILEGIGAPALLPIVPLVRHHHEWFNGCGYPDGIAGDTIPLGAAIIAVADAFDTMTTDRPYRSRCSAAAAISELRRWAGEQFNPRVVDVFARVIESDAAMAGDATHLPIAVPRELRLGPVAGTPGRIADARALGLLVELAGLTRHIPDLRTFLRSVTEMIRRRLGYESIYLLLVDREREDFALAAHSGNLHGVVDDNYRQPLDVGICGDVYRTGRIRNIPNVHAEPLHYDPDPSVPVESEIVVPLIVNDEVIGVISAESSQRAAFTASDEMVLTAVADQLAMAIHVAQLHDQAKRAAATDGLTGLANHRAFYEALEAAVATGQPFALVLFDVEGLKEINDTAGHLAGDALLRRVGQTIREMVRATDIVARYGGDEFAVILQEATAEQAAAIAIRVRQRLLECEMPVPGVRATVRYGVAAAPADGTRPMSLVAVADSRMYDMHARVRRSRPGKVLVRQRMRPQRSGLRVRPHGLERRPAE